MFKAYERAAKDRQITLGKMDVHETGKLSGPRYIINFPTKQHWRARSRLDDMRSGLVDLVRVVDELGIKSIAVPPLGCGNGGLDWRDVEPLIASAFDQLPDVDVLVFQGPVRPLRRQPSPRTP